MSKKPIYDESSIQSLDWKSHIRQRPGMYIGKLGNGKSSDDGIYVLLKEVIDNSIDEYVMGYGKKIKIKIKNKTVIIRDYGRGIPLGKVIECVSKINTVRLPIALDFIYIYLARSSHQICIAKGYQQRTRKYNHLITLLVFHFLS